MTVNKKVMITLEDIINNYVFHNPVKIFFNPKLNNKTLQRLTKIKKEIRGSRPFKYSIKVNNKIRILSFPNFFTYVNIANILYSHSEKFQSIKSLSKNRMQIKYNQRRFEPDNYRQSNKKDADDLLFNFELMSFFDIRNFYNSIYTHSFEKIKCGNATFGFIDEHIRYMNSCKTKGFLLGNILSLICANELLEALISKISLELNCQEIYHDISYFSDQIYIKHNVGFKSEVEKIVKNILAQDYFEFLLAEEKTKVFSYEQFTKNKIFEHYSEKIMNIGLCKKRSIDLEFKDLKKETDQEKTKLNTNNILHFFNLLIEQLLSDELPLNLKESYLKVTLRKIFTHPIALVKLYQFCHELGENNKGVMEIINKLLFVISKYPSVIYDLYQLSLFEIIPFEKNVTDEQLEKLYNRFHREEISEFKLLYWFFKIVILKKETLNIDFEKIEDDNYLLIAFIIRIKPTLLDENLILKCEELINSVSNLFEEQWLVFYEYSIYKQKTHSDIISEKYKHQSNKVIKIVNDLIREKFSLLNNLDELTNINELSKTNKRWKLDEIKAAHNRWIMAISQTPINYCEPSSLYSSSKSPSNNTINEIPF